MIPDSSKAWEYRQHGVAQEVLQEVKLPISALQDDQVLLRLILSPIHPSDFGIIAGSYGKTMSLPAIGGREGVAEVIATGAEVCYYKPGQVVRMPEAYGTWQEYVVAHADELMLVPDDISPEQAAMAFINPTTAYCLLNEFATLKEGDWIIQNAATSAVGICVISLARKMGLRTINVVRDAQRQQELKEKGADLIVLEGSDYFKQIDEMTSGSKASLALNSIGGSSVISLVRSLKPSATLITFGGMSSDKIRFPTRELIFNDLKMRGFWMDTHWRSLEPTARQELMHKVFKLIKEGVFEVPIDRIYPLEDTLEALAHAGRAGRHGKILISGSGYI